MDKLSRYYKVTEIDIIRRRTSKVKEARDVLIYLAKKYLRISSTDTGKLIGITQSSASRAMSRGMKIVEEKKIMDKLLN